MTEKTVSSAEVPLVWTTRGNLPIADLRYEVLWESTSDYVKFIERYYLDAELVKESAHVLSRQPMTSEAAPGQVGG